MKNFDISRENKPILRMYWHILTYFLFSVLTSTFSKFKLFNPHIITDKPLGQFIMLLLYLIPNGYSIYFCIHLFLWNWVLKLFSYVCMTERVAKSGIWEQHHRDYKVVCQSWSFKFFCLLLFLMKNRFVCFCIDSLLLEACGCIEYKTKLLNVHNDTNKFRPFPNLFCWARY